MQCLYSICKLVVEQISIRKEEVNVTRNQIDYRKHLEDVEHNRNMEAAQREANAETAKHNRNMEAVNYKTYLETVRANQAKEGLTLQDLYNQGSMNAARVEASDKQSKRQYKASKYSADSSRKASKYSADTSKSASKYSADSSRAASKYSADSHYSATIDATNIKAAVDKWLSTKSTTAQAQRTQSQAALLNAHTQANELQRKIGDSKVSRLVGKADAALKRAQTQLAQRNSDKVVAEIEKWWEELALAWAKADNDKDKAYIDAYRASNPLIKALNPTPKKSGGNDNNERGSARSRYKSQTSNSKSRRQKGKGGKF